jgi:hypothetical protein
MTSSVDPSTGKFRSGNSRSKHVIVPESEKEEETTISITGDITFTDITVPLPELIELNEKEEVNIVEITSIPTSRKKNKRGSRAVSSS